ncbi:MAG TPA: hypothetical protein VIM30_17390 [Candidatus Limnocylindrales bacterium]|jgi:D-serine deaminase-like pyridoxal phosphate-dependent protein
MNTSARPTTTGARDRALARLRTITVGTALAGVAATGAFGSAAAMTYSGHSGGTLNVATTANSTAPTTTANPTTNETTATQSTNSSSSSSLQSASKAATSTSGSGQITTGGS